MKNIGKMTPTLVLVSSPFQYLCAVELLKSHNICGAVIVVDGSAHCINSVKQLSALYANFPPTQVINASLLKQGDLAERIASYSWIPSEFAGVNLDTEAAALIEFQQAYQASARILSTARELFNSLMEVV